MDKIQWGIIGCGDVTELKSGPAFNKVKNSALVAVMRRDAVKAQDYARRHGVPVWYSDAQQLIDDPAVNAVYVATPPQSHEEFTLRAFKAGKAVYVEKPMATDAAAARRMLQASLDTGMKLCVAHYRKAQPRFVKVKALLEAGEIGVPLMVNLQLRQTPPASLATGAGGNWRIDPSISGGGLFHDLAPHQLDLLQYFFGDYESAVGVAKNQAALYAADDLVTGIVTYKSGVVFTGSWCFNAAEKEEKDLVEIIGSAGSIRFAAFSTHYITLSKKGEERQLVFDELQHVQQPMIEAVTQYFLGQGPNPSTAASAVATMEIIDAFTTKNRPFTNKL